MFCHQHCRSSQSTTGTENRRNASRWAFAVMAGLLIMMIRGENYSQLSIDLDIKLQIIVAPYESPPVQNFAGSRYRTRYIICRWVRSCQASSGDYKATLNDKEKTPTNTKCLEDPTYVIFLKSRKVSFAQQISLLFELPSLTNMWQISKSIIHIVWGKFPLIP